MSRRVEIAATAEAFRDTGATLIERFLGVHSRRVCVMLAGGSTPNSIYEAVATRPLPWERLHVFWGDERCVPPDDELSNYRSAREALLDRVPIPAANIHRIPGELAAPDAARTAEIELRDVVGRDPLDLVLLGMGADGHVASLFPGAPALDEQQARFVPTAGPFAERITVTLPVINSAHHVLVMVQGAAKAHTVRSVLRAVPSPALPATLIAPTRGDAIWLLDAAAASELAA